MQWNDRYTYYQNIVEEALDGAIPLAVSPWEEGQIPQRLAEAMRYSLLSKGKRIRPVLLLAALDVAGGDLRCGIPFAVAIEMIHAYSLIHDDLPAMDNDMLRRGQPTNHCKFGEWTAILAGDALLTEAFHIMAQSDSPYALKVIKEMAKRAGAYGMVAGQTADLSFEGKLADENMLSYIHRHKTSDLFIASMNAGFMLAGSDDGLIKAAENYAKMLGLAFQITDDLLDVLGSSEEVGKAVGKDDDKLTWTNLKGVEQAKIDAEKAVQKAVDYAQSFDFSDYAFFAPLAQSLLQRVK